MSSENNKTAEQVFREAFERLKKNRPLVVEKNAKISQNNIAREAGRDPSALKRSRHPILVLEIQNYIDLQKDRTNQAARKSDNRTRTVKQKLENCQAQRDKLSSIVAAQNNYINDLVDEIERLKEGKVSKL